MVLARQVQMVLQLWGILSVLFFHTVTDSATQEEKWKEFWKTNLINILWVRNASFCWIKNFILLLRLSIPWLKTWLWNIEWRSKFMPDAYERSLLAIKRFMRRAVYSWKNAQTRLCYFSNRLRFFASLRVKHALNTSTSTDPVTCFVSMLCYG